MRTVAAPFGVLSGLGLIYLALWLWRQAGRFLGGLTLLALAAVSLITGLALIPFSLILGQSRLDASGTGREAAAVAIGAALALLFGVGWAALGWRWLTAANGRARLRHLLQQMTIGCGVLLLPLGALLLAGVAAGVRDLTDDTLAASATAAGFGAVLLAGGGLLTYHGVNALMGGRSGPARIYPFALWLLLWLAAIGAGAGVLASGRGLGALPPLHIAGAITAGLGYIALVARQPLGALPQRRIAWRSLGLAWAWGAAVATLSASVLESIADSVVSLTFLAQSGALREVASGAELQRVIADADHYLSHRTLLAATLALFSVTPPLIEETAKGLGVRLLGWRRMTRYEGFLLGAASGAGFGTLEAVLYGASALDQAPDQWWLLMLLRGGATSMHALATGLFGLGVVSGLRGERLRLAACVLGALLMHASWNGLNVIAVSDVLPLLHNLSERRIERLLDIALAGWSLLNLALLLLIGRILWREQPPAAAPVPELVVVGEARS